MSVGTRPTPALCFMNCSRSWGGGEKWHLDAAVGMQARGRRVVVVADPNGAFRQRLDKTQVKLFPLSAGNASWLNLLKLWKLRGFFLRNRVHTVVMNSPTELKLGGVAAKAAGVHRIVYRRGSALPVGNNALNRFLFGRVLTDVIVNSEATRSTMLARNPHLFPREGMRVIYNGLDLAEYDRLPCEPLVIRDTSEVLLGSAGRLTRQKGQLVLVELARELMRRGRSVRILVAGKGPRRDALLNRARELGVEKNIILTGFVNNMRSFMATIDIFLLPSLWEGFGYVLVEAMASRLPVIASRVSSNPEVVVDRRTGFLIDKVSAEGLAEKVETLIDDPELRREMGEEGRKRVEEEFSLDGMMERLTEVLHPRGNSD